MGKDLFLTNYKSVLGSQKHFSILCFILDVFFLFLFVFLLLLFKNDLKVLFCFVFSLSFFPPPLLFFPFPFLNLLPPPLLFHLGNNQHFHPDLPGFDDGRAILIFNVSAMKRRERMGGRRIHYPPPPQLSPLHGGQQLTGLKPTKAWEPPTPLLHVLCREGERALPQHPSIPGGLYQQPPTSRGLQ